MSKPKSHPKAGLLQTPTPKKGGKGAKAGGGDESSGEEGDEAVVAAAAAAASGQKKKDSAMFKQAKKVGGGESVQGGVCMVYGGRQGDSLVQHQEPGIQLKCILYIDGYMVGMNVERPGGCYHYPPSSCERVVGCSSGSSNMLQTWGPWWEMAMCCGCGL